MKCSIIVTEVIQLKSGKEEFYIRFELDKKERFIVINISFENKNNFKNIGNIRKFIIKIKR